jgi:putative membrane protein
MKIVISFLSILFFFTLISCEKKSEYDTAKIATDSNKATIDTNKKAGAPDFSAEAAFAVRAADGGMLEVQLSQRALTNGTSKKVKEFAKIMIKDHTAAGNDLNSLAKAKGIAIPAALSDKNQKIYDDLTKLKGADFDKAYMAQMVTDHNAAVNDFEKQSKDSKDADFKSWTGQELPTLIHHLDMAKAIKDAMKS